MRPKNLICSPGTRPSVQVTQNYKELSFFSLGSAHLEIVNLKLFSSNKNVFERISLMAARFLAQTKMSSQNYLTEWLVNGEKLISCLSKVTFAM